MTYYT